MAEVLGIAEPCSFLHPWWECRSKSNLLCRVVHLPMIGTLSCKSAYFRYLFWNVISNFWIVAHWKGMPILWCASFWGHNYYAGGCRQMNCGSALPLMTLQSSRWQYLELRGLYLLSYYFTSLQRQAPCSVLLKLWSSSWLGGLSFQTWSAILEM